jgi:hypothetical protein
VLFDIAEEISAIFYVGKRNIQNWKMIDNWGNTNIALPPYSNKKRKSSDQARIFYFG